MPSLSFSDLSLSNPLLEALTQLGYENPSAIQQAAIPPLLQGEDILGVAQTGTGKTAAFALPLLNALNLGKAPPQGLVLTPTRELALQVAEAFQAYARCLQGFHVLPIYGGQSFGLQLKSLKRGPQVIVGTPGRIRDHISRGTLDLSHIRMLVLDEADEMLRMGFIEEVEAILEEMPTARQTALFSATMPKPIRHISRRYMREPREIQVDPQSSTVKHIEQSHWMVSGTNKLDALTRILETEERDAVLVFARTRTATVEIAEKLSARGYAAAALNGDMNQQAREQTVDSLKKGRLDVVVATDVAARGLDVDRITLVINNDIPLDPEAYVHRIGRTGRAGRAGKAILFVTPRERRLLKAIERTIGKSIPAMHLPTTDQVTEARIKAFRQRLNEACEKNLDFYRDLIQELLHELEQSPEELAAGLLYLAQEERPLQPPPEKHQGKGKKPGGDWQQHSSSETLSSQRYRIQVGRRDGLKVGQVVGAIANEAGIEGRHIGAIEIGENSTEVDLPADMPKEIFQHLQKVRVCGRPLRIQAAEGRGDARDDTRRPRGAKASPRSHRKGPRKPN